MGQRLLHNIEVTRILDTERVAFLAITHGQAGCVYAEGNTITAATDNLRTEVARIRTPIISAASQARDEQEWAAMYWDWVKE